MDTTLPGLMSMPIHRAIMSLIITLIKREVRRHIPLETGGLVHACLSALPGGGL